MALPLKTRHVSEVAWVAIGQLSSAIGTILGLRLLTEFLHPATFGVLSLSLGAAQLAVNAACTPFAQAVLHFYPQYIEHDAIPELRDSVRRALRPLLRWLVLAVVVICAIYVLYDHGSALICLLVAALLACDMQRAMQLAFLNAARRHSRYASWVCAEAWCRPLTAVGALFVFGESAPAVLASYVAVSASLLVVFRERGVELTAARAEMSTDTTLLEKRVWHYAAPIIPAGLVGWFNGLGDRYIIGLFLSVADAGLYGAVYGLTSRPFLMLGDAIELMVRPIYQTAVSAGERARARTLFTVWSCGVALAACIGVAIVSLFRTEIAALFLGKNYRGGAVLMPWIACGYGLLMIARVFQRVSYSTGRTTHVLMVEISVACIGLIATTAGIMGWGLMGAAIAVPVYFAAQLIITIVLAYAPPAGGLPQPLASGRS